MSMCIASLFASSVDRKLHQSENVEVASPGVQVVPPIKTAKKQMPVSVCPAVMTVGQGIAFHVYVRLCVLACACMCAYVRVCACVYVCACVCSCGWGGATARSSLVRHPRCPKSVLYSAGWARRMGIRIATRFS